MEILFVTHKYPPVTGGMEKQSFELINGMKTHIKVHAIVYEGQESKITFFRLLNQRIRQVCKTNPGISIIHFNDGLIAAFSLFHTGYAHLKQCVTLHGLDVVYPNWIYQQYILPKFNRFDLIIAVSEATAEACRIRGILKENIAVVNNGVDTQIRPAAIRDKVDLLLRDNYHVESKGRRLLVAMGRPVKRKGFSWFIKNVSPSLHHDFLFLLIGPVSKKKNLNFLSLLPPFIAKPISLFFGLPGDENAIEKLIAKPGSRNRVVRLGKLPFNDICSLLSVSDAFVMPNIDIDGDMEGFGLVCLEAAMCGTKVIAAASGGITDAIHQDKNGVLLPPGNIPQWVNTINNLQEIQTPLPADIISYTRTQFSWEKMITDYLREFKKINR